LAVAKGAGAEEVEPDAGCIVESLRDFGYTLETALADLIDNSITAGAQRINVVIEDSKPTPYIAVMDDGCGMDLKTLVEAMRMGTRGPEVTRAPTDLGRFGLGMKTASLSQGRAFTVITRQKGRKPLIRRWDIEHIRKRRKWQLLATPTTIAERFLKQLSTASQGTVIVIEDLDRPSFLRVPPEQRDEHFGAALETVRRHLSMVFHRFMQGGMEIRLGAHAIVPWDPFLVGQSTQLAMETIPLGAEKMTIKPWVLPHHSKLTAEEHARAGGLNGWNAHQGFYVYRCNRLIVPGTWLNLQLKKEEHYKLARIQLDLPNSMDPHWQLNVMKSHVAAPAWLRDDLRRIAQQTRNQAAQVYRHRGEKQAPASAPPQRFVWKREESGTGVRYRVDRTHPVMQALLHGGCAHQEVLKTALNLIEASIPISTMLQEPARAIDGSVLAEPTSEELQQLAEMARHAIHFFVSAGRKPTEARSTVLAAEPFVRHREAILHLLQKHS
jgi:hypothetical protein